MAREFAVGLFQSKGTAEDACNRLRTEGVAGNRISLVVLHDIAPTPQVLSPTIEALTLDPLMLGDVRNTFAPYITNGETAVFVAADTPADIEQALDTMQQYAPIKVVVLAAEEGAPLSRTLP